jgi:predicted Zn-dependent protease with MMP-like domain
MKKEIQDFVDYYNVLELPPLDLIKEYANNALLCCPPKFQKVLASTTVTVENFVTIDILQELNVLRKEELLGLYKVFDSKKKRELVLFRVPLIMYSIATSEDIESVVARVTVYEISHRANCVSLRKQWLSKIKSTYSL